MSCENCKLAFCAFLFCGCLSLASNSHAETWSTTEIHLQYGQLSQTGTGGAEADYTILTFQHAGGWEYGDNFFFIDHLDFESNKNGSNPFNPGTDGTEFYGEWYSNFSLGKIRKKEIKFGPVSDIGIIAGFNFAPEVDSWWFLPGVRFSLNIPGFAFANLDITAYLNHSSADSSTTEFKIFDEGDSWMVDFNWAYPFDIGKTSWSLEGHIEYINGRTQVNTFGTTELSSHILAQPQLRLDLGKAVGGTQGKIFVGIEYQYWRNKQGEDGTNDNDVQFLLVWRF